MSLVSMAEQRWLPDALIRIGIRRLLRQRLAEVTVGDQGRQAEATVRFAAELRQGPIALAAEQANEQHYEAPVEFFQSVLGARLKYSCGYWPRGRMTLDESEQAMLDLTCQRAELEDGMEILDLGCGWGSLSLWIAEHYPACRILALSNSHSQRACIEQTCRDRGLRNVQVATSNVAEFATDRRFDRVLSVEMFEHIRNYEWLLAQIATWLKPAGKLFVHIFCHRQAAYPFEQRGRADWMAQHFFTGGIMPSADLLRQFDRDLAVDAQWLLDGTHYSRTCEAWLANLDDHEQRLTQLFAASMPRRDAAAQLQRWRMFFMACSELFKFREGSEWGVAHYLLSHSPDRRSGGPGKNALVRLA